MMRRSLPLLITLVAGIVLAVSKFLPPIESWGEDFTIWFDILAAIAFVLGGGNLMKVHTRKVRKQMKGWGYSGVTIGFFVFTLSVGLSKCGIDPSHGYPYSVVVSHSENPLAWVVVKSKVHIAAIPESGSLTIGRGEGADIVVDGAGVDDIHVRIHRSPGGFEVESLGAAGTLLEGRRVEGRSQISDGDKLRIGDVGDPVVTFRTHDSIILQIKRQGTRGKFTTGIGSDPASAIRLLGDAGVDPNHAEIIFSRKDEATLTDIEGGRGTTVNGQAVTDPGGQELAKWDAIGVGGYEVTYRRNTWLTGAFEGATEESPFWYCYEFGFRPLVAATFAMLAFYVASAAYRAFRAKNMEALVLLATAFLILLGRTFLGTVVTAWAPEGYQVPDITVWIMKVINSAGNRAIMIGIALGIASMSLKVILGIDRSYLGGEE